MHKISVILSHDAIDSFEFSPLSLHSNAEKYTSARESHEDKQIQKEDQKVGSKRHSWVSLCLTPAAGGSQS